MGFSAAPNELFAIFQPCTESNNEPAHVSRFSNQLGPGGYELRRICYLHRLLSFSAALKHAFCSPCRSARLSVLFPSAHNPIPYSGSVDSTCHLVCSLSRYFPADITDVLQITDLISRSVGFSVSFEGFF